MRLVNLPNIPNAVNTLAPAEPKPALPSAPSAQGNNTRAQAKAPDSMKQQHRQSSKRPREFAQMPSQAGLGSVATTSHIPAPFQSATQAFEDPFPMDEGWESLELFDTEVNKLSDESWAHEAELSQTIASNGLAAPGLLEPHVALSPAAIAQVEDSKPLAKRQGPVEQPQAQPNKRSRGSSQRSSLGVSNSVGERAHITISGRAAARTKEQSVLLNADRGVQKKPAPHANRLSGAAGLTAATGVRPSPEFLRAQVIHAISQCAANVSRDASVIEAAQRDGVNGTIASPLFKYMKRVGLGAAEFVEQQARIVQNNQADMGELEAALQKCTAGQNAIRMLLVNGFNPGTEKKIERQMVDAFRMGGEQSLIEAAAAAAMYATRPVLWHRDLNRVTLATAGAAAAVAVIAIKIATRLSPSSKEDVARAIKNSLNQNEEGLVVSRFIGGARKAHTAASLAAAQVQIQQIKQEILQCVSEVSRCASVVDDADKLIEEQALLVAVFKAVKRASMGVAQFVQAQAETVSNDQATPIELADARRRCTAGKEAMQRIASNSFSDESLNQVRTQISNAVRDGQQSPAQAAAAIARRAAMPVLSYPDLQEVVHASAAAAAAVVITAQQLANRLSPPTRAENERIIQQALEATPEGQEVSRFIRAVRQSPMQT